MDLPAGQVNPNPIVPDNRNCQNQGIDSVKHAAVSREQRTGILHVGAPLVSRLKQIARLPGDVSASGHPQQVKERDVYVFGERYSDQKRAENARRGAFPGFLGAENGREFVIADGAAYEVRGGVASPGDDEDKEQKARTEKAKGVKTNRERKRKSDENQRAGAEARCGQRFDHGAAGPQRQDCNAEQEDEEHVAGVQRKKK